MKQVLKVSIAVVLTLLIVQQNQAQSFREDFSTDIIASGDWVSSGPSVSVDQANGWLHISSNGAHNDFADKYGNFQLPLVIEWRERLVSGGRDYTLPNFGLFWGTTDAEADYITYLPNTTSTVHWGWRFGNTWTDIHTLGPSTENQWRTIRAVLRTDGGDLYAKADGDADFTHIVTRAWSIPNKLVRIRLVQNWDAVCDYDYVQVSASNPWCDGFEAYDAGTFPSSDWNVFTSGSGVAIDNTISFNGARSLKTYAAAGGCWEEGASHQIGVSLPFSVEFEVRNGREQLSGCHPYRAGYTTAVSSTCCGPHSGGILFNAAGDLMTTIGPWVVFPGYSLETWIRIRMEYLAPGDGNLHVRVWANGDFLGDFTRPWEDWMSSLSYGVFSSGEGSAWFDDVCVNPLPPVRTVALDIKPGSCPNPINLTTGPKKEEPEIVVTTDAAGKMAPAKTNSGKEVLPTAILGSLRLNVSTIDVSSIRLVGVAPIRSSFEDVSVPVGVGSGQCACTTDGPDGFVDLTLKFYKDDIVATLGTMSVGETRELKITGKLTDGSDFEGSDCIVVVGNPHASASGIDDVSAERLFNYPNPFNPATTISFALPVAGHVTVKVYNSIGQEVATLVDEDRPVGAHQVLWDANSFASGVYLYRLTTDGFTETKKMLLMK